MFTLNQASLLRVHGKADSLIALQIVNNATGVNVGASWMEQDPELFLAVPAGTYVMRVNSFMILPTFCPKLNMEIAIAPQISLPNNCPGQESIPNLGTITVPFSFPANPTPTPTAYFAYTNNAVIRSYSFTLDAVSVLEAMLDSDFLTSGLKLSLQFTSPGNQREISGYHKYNRNYLHEILDPGNYTLKITRPSLTNPIATLPPCAEFNFFVTLKNMAQVDQEPCLQSGEEIPTTFNSVRFLGPSQQFDFQSTEFRVPTFSTIISKQISIQVNNISAFRVYTEPHVVDIDLILYQETEIVADGGFGFNNEESLTYILQPGHSYTLLLNFWKWSQDVPACPTFNMEVAVVPEVYAQLNTANCPIVDNWPPAPPRIPMPDTPYHYDSALHDTLYYTQSTDHKKTSPALQFSLTAATNLHAELGYNFISGDLLMRLESSGTSEIYYGVNGMSGNVLNVVGLPAGSYNLYLYEVTQNVQANMGCSRFTFELHIERDQQSLFANIAPHLPVTLNSIPYLLYDGRVHLQSDYTLFDESANTNEKVKFTLQETSLVRVTTNHKLELGALQIELLDSNNNFIASFYETMLDFLDPGTYTIQFDKPIGSSGRVTVNVELEVAPRSLITNDINNYYPPLASTCADSSILSNNGVIIPSPKGSYSYRNDDLHISQSTQTRSSVIQILPIQLSRASILYAQLGSNFLLGDLEWQLTGTATGSGKQIQVYGRNGRNINEINEQLPIGNYQLKITQPALFRYDSYFPHCTVYSARIVINDALSNTHVDCSAYAAVPWDLNTPDGGSVAYGGPISSRGTLHLYGDSFLMPSDSGAVDTVRLRVNQSSLLAIVTRESYYGDITFTVETGTSIKLMTTALVTTSDHYQRHSIYSINGYAAGTNYEVLLNYQPPQRTACPYFGLQLVLQPTFQVSRSLACPVQITPQYPKTTVNPGDDGSYMENIDSYIPSTSPNPFPYEIQITVTSTSVLFVSLSYNALVNLFDMKLDIVGRTGLGRKICAGQIRMQVDTSGMNNINQILSGSLTPGTYFIVLSQPTFSVPLGNGTFCFPFLWNMRLVPDTGFVYVSNIEPAGGNSLSPQSNITLEITFSDPIYSQGTQVTANNPGPIQRAFYLESGTTQIFPSSVSNDGIDPLFWYIIFPSSSLSPRTTYQLRMASGILYDSPSSSKAVNFITTNRYTTIDSSCNNHGIFDSGFCFCRVGWAGKECTECAPGYELVNGNCKRKISNLCYEDSCGCSPQSSQICIPLGTCSDTTGAIVCTCQKPYTGPTCNQCDDGYEMTSNGCTKKSGQCPICIRGACDPSVGRCVCPDHFSGRTCDECALGWSGSDCNTEVPYDRPSTTESKYGPALGAFRVIIIVVACIVIVGTVAFLLYRKYFHKGKYFSVGMEDLELDNEDETHAVEGFDKLKPRKKASSDEDKENVVPLE